MPKIIDKKEVPYNLKLCLTFDEASEYSGLPLGTIKKLSKADDCDFLMFPSKRGRTPLIKRELFEEYIRNHQIV